MNLTGLTPLGKSHSDPFKISPFLLLTSEIWGLPFWRSEVWDGYHRGKIKVLAGSHAFQRL